MTREGIEAICRRRGDRQSRVAAQSKQTEPALPLLLISTKSTVTATSSVGWTREDVVLVDVSANVRATRLA